MAIHLTLDLAGPPGFDAALPDDVKGGIHEPHSTASPHHPEKVRRWH